ncbi:MAG: hypothetical protein HY923_07985 [Elusimicrobia bacterium]|nr:hypothetical protein [Elusimicrobiota bacterium]
MDPKMPDIKSEVNKVDDGKKKSAGLAGLFGGGGGSAAGGLGGLGAGAAGGGGLLATKAGVLALVLMGSAVAGGIGLAGYKMFGPGDADKAGGNLSLFAPRPQAADPGAAAPSGDGTSASLDMMAQSAAKDKAAEAAASGAPDAGAPTDKTAGDPAREAAAADAARREAEAKAAGAINSGGGNGAVGSMGKGLANVKKLGGLSSASGGGGSTTAGSGNAAGRLGDNMANATRNGASSAFAKGGPGAKTNSFGRSAVGGKGRGVNAQLRSVLGDQAKGKAGSSYAAGRTYDGGAANNGGAIGPDGGMIGMDGAGDGRGAQPKSVSGNQVRPNSEFEPPLTKPAETYSPYTKAAARAQMLMMMALVLGYIASKLDVGDPYTKAIRIVIGIVIMAIGAYIGVLAGQILAGKHSQGMLGSMVALTGVGAIIMGAQVCASSGNSAAEDTKANAGTFPKPMLLGGAFMVVGMLGMMFNKPKPIELKPGEDPPDVRIEQKGNPVRYTV